MVWDGLHGHLLVATQPDSPNYPDALVAVDPVTGQIVAVATAAGNVWSVHMSSNRQSIYCIAASDSRTWLKLNASDLQVELTVASGSTSAVFQQIDPSPLAPGTVAVQVADTAAVPWATNLEIVDDGSPRQDIANTAPTLTYDGRIPFALRWAEDGSAVYLGATYASAVGPTGLGPFVKGPYPAPGHTVDRRVFMNNGYVTSLVDFAQITGTMPDVLNGNDTRDELPASGKAFSGRWHLFGGGFVDGSEITAYDLDHYGWIDNIVFNGAANFSGGMVVTWGTEGLAVGGITGLLIAHGTFAAPGGLEPAVAKIATVGQGVTLSKDTAGKQSALTFRVANLYANDIAADNCGSLYAAVTGQSPIQANNIVRLDPQSLAFEGSGWAGSEPTLLSVADDCSTIYATLAGATSFVRLRLPALTRDAEIHLGQTISGFGYEAVYATSLAVAPGSPNTVAAVIGSGRAVCPNANLGFSIYDDSHLRATHQAPPGMSDTKSITWGADANALFAIDALHGYEFAIDASGVGAQTTIFDPPVGPTSGYLPRHLLYSPARHQIVDSLGSVFDVNVPGSVNRLDLPTPVVVGTCIMPLQAQAVDATTGRIFYAQTFDRTSLVDDMELLITSLDPSTFKRIQVASIRMREMGLVTLSEPARLVRSGSNSLVLLLDSGQVVAFSGSMLSP
jgi:hypothetical protein